MSTPDVNKALELSAREKEKNVISRCGVCDMPLTFPVEYLGKIASCSKCQARITLRQKMCMKAPSLKEPHPHPPADTTVQICSLNIPFLDILATVAKVTAALILVWLPIYFIAWAILTGN